MKATMRFVDADPSTPDLRAKRYQRPPTTNKLMKLHTRAPRNWVHNIRPTFSARKSISPRDQTGRRKWPQLHVGLQQTPIPACHTQSRSIVEFFPFNCRSGYNTKSCYQVKLTNADRFHVSTRRPNASEFSENALHWQVRHG